MSAEFLTLRGRTVIIGAGLAGLMTALELAPQPVVLLSKGPLGGEGSTLWAQGGLAAALGAADSPEAHAADTLSAGDGLCDPAAVEYFTRAAPAAIERLARLGVRFDRDANGGYALGLEAAHRSARIVHAGGDGSGRELMRALVAAARAAPSITILEGVEARRLIVEDGKICGFLASGPAGVVSLAADKVVIATGGIGGLFEDSTNPPTSFGQGLALAARAGAVLADVEFIQFHPTALDVACPSPPLISEAVRGEGAILIDETGERFMADTPGGELAPRDIVARAIWRHRAGGRRVFLDARAALGGRFATRFPTIAAACQANGVDPAREPIPVRPAQHYHMGGVAVDAEGRSSLASLWVCGEAAATGLHGANRLASNSLIEAVVGAAAIARSIEATPSRDAKLPRAANRPLGASDPRSVRPLLTRAAGVEREAGALRAALTPLAALARSTGPSADPATVALTIVAAAFRREHSLGAHCRRDFLQRPATPRRSRITLDEALAISDALVPTFVAKRA